MDLSGQVADNRIDGRIVGRNEVRIQLSLFCKLTNDPSCAKEVPCSDGVPAVRAVEKPHLPPNFRCA